MLSRRDFLAASATASLFHALEVRPALAQTSVRPKAFIQIFLRGGLDAIMSTNPRRRNEVDAHVDLPYEEAAIHTVGDVRLAPLLRPLAPHLPRMAIVNGVVGGTVAHETGLTLIQEMRRVFPKSNGLGLVGTVGEALRGDSPLASVWFQGSFDRTKWRPPTGRSLVIPSGANAIERLVEIARNAPMHRASHDALESELRRCLPTESCEAQRAIFELLERLAVSPALPALPGAKGLRIPSGVDVNDRWEDWRGTCRDIAFILENRLAPAVFVDPPPRDWDSHTKNLYNQTYGMEFFTAAFNLLMNELRTRHTADGVDLASQTAIVISSEIGRYPMLNAQQGKDHFPEMPFMFFGPGLRAGQYGETDRKMASVPISFKTGRASGVTQRAPTIDDVGATVLRWLGIEDTKSRGYIGDSLDFLLA